MTKAEFNRLVRELDRKLISGEISAEEYREYKLRLRAMMDADERKARDQIGADPGSDAKEKAIRKYSRDIQAIYGDASEEMRRKLQEFTDKYQSKLARKQREKADGRITSDEFWDWLNGQQEIMGVMRNKIDQLSGVMLAANEKAMAMVNDEMLGVFAENANWQSYQLEQDAKMDLMFSIYDEHTVERLIREKPELLPRRKVKGRKDKAWNQKQIANAVTQAILQGESIPDLARRIAKETAEKNGKAMIRYARTAMTGAQNSGRIEMLHRADGLGIKVKKRWLATLDSRTRDSHQHMDGVSVGVDEDFRTPLGSKMQYPGDINGKGGDVWNCRCTLVYDYDGFPNDPDVRRDNETDEVIPNMTYDEWKKYKSGGRQAAEEETEEEEDARYLQKLRDEQEQLQKRGEELRKQWRETYDEQDDLDKRIREIARKGMLLDRDYSMFDRFDSEKEYNTFLADMTARIEQIDADIAKMKRPRRDDFRTDEEYEAAFNKYLEERINLKNERERQERKLYSYYNAFPTKGWAEVSDWRDARDDGRDNLSKELESLKEERVKVIEKRRKIEEAQRANQGRILAYNELKMIDEAASRKVAYKKPEKYKAQPTTDEIVKRLGGGDETDGSCMSLGLCYIAQKNGIDVIDFRGGQSQKMFSERGWGMMRAISAETGKELMTEETKTGTGGAIRLAKRAEQGKEYCMVTGRHCAIIRNNGGVIEYMELQSNWQNGWSKLGNANDRSELDHGFRWRFGSSTRISGTAVMMDIEDMKESRILKRALGYMNTDEDKQKKGASGHEK